jgi:hypothetical protein
MHDQPIEQNDFTLWPEAKKEKVAFDAEVRLMEHLKAATIGAPGCGRAGCFGQGYLGITTTHDKDGKPHLTLLTCKCAQVGKSEYALLNQRITDLINHLSNVFTALEQADHQRIEKATTELSAEIAMHSNTISRQIDEIENFISVHTFLGLIGKAIEWIQDTYQNLRAKETKPTLEAVNEKEIEPTPGI